jgi:mannose-1-phosphate guanylyltransferase/mannose-6-phosphate isomerase
MKQANSNIPKSSKTDQLIPVILSGGSGTRLWPLSRTHYPKQFCDVFDESLFKKTAKRLMTFGSPWVVTNQSMRVLTESVLNEIKVPLIQALYEPKARNTAPAVALICKVLSDRGMADSIAGIFPSDHLIQNEIAFSNAIQLGIACAKQGQVVTLGIQPTFPATGYGYIEVLPKVYAESTSMKAHVTAGFREKPNEATAQEFIAGKAHYWNAGMFIFKVSKMIYHFQTLMPDLWAEITKLNADLSNLSEVYQRAPAQSVDYGIMEKLKDQVCIPCDLDWSDVGSWDEIAKLTQSSPTVQIQAHGNYAFSNQGRLVSLVGVDDLIVVDTADALLISKKGSTQLVKQVTEALNSKQDNRAHDHTFEFRPWGRFEVLRNTTDFKSKVIHVNPGQRLSYQSHKKRAEHWVITQGHPEITLNDQVTRLKPGESIYIPQGAKHRIANPSPTDMVEFIEVQIGTYFGEDDITRYQDDYQRL